MLVPFSRWEHGVLFGLERENVSAACLSFLGTRLGVDPQFNSAEMVIRGTSVLRIT